MINQQDATLAVLCFLTTTSMLYMFRTPFVSIIRSTMNCNSSHWCYDRPCTWPSTWPIITSVAAVTVYSAPEDGRKGRPKYVEHTCSF